MAMTKKKTEETKTAGLTFTADAASLTAALAKVVGAVDKRGSMPILSHVKIDVFLRNAVGFTATDLEVCAFADTERVSVPGAGGGICAPAELLKAALSAMSGQITVTLIAGQRLLLEGNGRRFEVTCLDVADFPAAALDFQDPVLRFEPGRLPRLLGAVRHAASQDDSKYNLCGINLCRDQGRLTATATDGHRLSLAAVEMDGIDAFDKLLLPAKAARILAGAVSGVSLALGTEGKNGNQVLFDAADLELTVRLIDGDFPDYRRVIPTNYDQHLVIDAAALADAVSACAVVGEGRFRMVCLECPEDAFGESLTVSALSADGVATATVPCMGGTGFKTGVNSKYLLQALKALGDGEVFIKCGDKAGPLLIVPVDHGSWDERLEVIMPCRI
jgi:DNA polymerase-3 subunit beta